MSKSLLLLLSSMAVSVQAHNPGAGKGSQGVQERMKKFGGKVAVALSQSISDAKGAGKIRKDDFVTMFLERLQCTDEDQKILLAFFCAFSCLKKESYPKSFLKRNEAFFENKEAFQSFLVQVKDIDADILPAIYRRVDPVFCQLLQVLEEGGSGYYCEPDFERWEQEAPKVEWPSLEDYLRATGQLQDGGDDGDDDDGAATTQTGGAEQQRSVAQATSALARMTLTADDDDDDGKDAQ